MYRIILVGPQTEGNLGFIARLMKNFGFEDLYLVNPEFEVGEEAEKRAMHAQEILDNLKIFKSLDKALEGLDYIVGTTGVQTTDKNVLRRGIPPEEFAERAGKVEGKIGLLLGREDKGLSNQELERCDFVITIPSSKEYPILNLSHAAGIIFYEIFKKESKEKEEIGNVGKEKEILEKTFKDTLSKLNYPEKKEETLLRCFKNMVGRSLLFKREAHSLIGVFKEIKQKIENSK